MFRTPKAGDWAADDDDDVEIAPIHMPTAVAETSPPPAAAKKPQAERSNSSTSSSNTGARNNSSRQEKSSSSEQAAGNRWGRNTDDNGRRIESSGSSSREYARSGSGGGYDRDNRRDGGYERRDNSGFERGGGGGFDRRDRDAGGYGGGRDSGRSYGGGGARDGGFSRDGGRDNRRQPHVELPVEQGVVVSIMESFGFVSCANREGDLFFHITEAPVDVQLQDEVEFRVKHNQRSDKEVASQLVILPKGTIVMEDVSEEFVNGVVTRGLRSGGSSSYNSSNSQRDDSHGTIEIVTKSAESAAEPVADGSEAAAPAKPLRRSVVRFNADSVNPVAVAPASKQQDDEAAAEQQEESSAKPQRRPKKSAVPHFGDEVRFRIATHRKTGTKRAVELTITVSAKAKLEKEIDAKLHTMVREHGVVERMKTGGGFIKCCDRQEELYFPIHEIRASDDEPVKTDAATVPVSTGDDAAAAAGVETTEKKSGKGKQSAKKPTLRDGDEVSFFVYEERDDHADASSSAGRSSSSRPRLTALRVQRVPKGTVSFEELIRSNVEGVVAKSPKEPRNGPEVIGSIAPTAAAAPAAPAAVTASVVAPGANKENAAGESNEKVESAAVSEDTKKSTKKPVKGDAKKKSGKTIAGGVSFRLSDTHDMSYSPIVGDVVLFDEVFEKRSGKNKAVNVRVVKLNPKNRESGVITSLREDFGFIKCADRPMDAFFRFSDVMAAHRDFRNGTEVAFDVILDPTKPENARATRVELLKHGTVQWETVVDDAMIGEIIALPSSSRGGGASGGRGGNTKVSSLKVTNGRIRFAPSCTKRFWLEFTPELKQKIDSLFVLADGEEPAPVVEEEVKEEAVKEEQQQATEEKSEEAGPARKKKNAKKQSQSSKKEIKLAFPSSLTKAERAAIHQYCDYLEIQHQSLGDGPSRKLELVASRKVPAKPVSDDLPALEVEFKSDDLAEIRYSPHVGDRVKLKLVLSKRTKQFTCKSVVCVEAAAGTSATSGPKSSKAKGEKKEVQRDEGFIVAVRSEGFGFIQPANAAVSSSGNGSNDDNLFFHIKEVTTGETLESLKEGMEVQYTTSYDEVKKKTRAVNIVVVPAGTIKKLEPEILRGVVSRPSLLNPLKSSKSSRYTKGSSKQAASSVGKIRVVAEGGEDAAAAVENEDDGDDAAEEGEGEQETEDKTDGDEEAAAAAAAAAAAGDETTGEAAVDPETRKSKAKAQSKPKRRDSHYTYNIKDIVDQNVVLREGDEVEFTATVSTKGPRASKIRVIALHAKQGVVTKILEDFSGFIRVDSGTDEEEDDATALEIPFFARNVLRGDVLSEGDRVEFAHSMTKPNATRKIGTAAAKAEAAEAAETAAAAAAGGDAVASGADIADEVKAEEPEKLFVGQATSVLRLSAAPGGGANGENSRSRAPRTVNSSLLQAMRQVGASAVVASRMAKGPDGTRGFKEGWRSGDSTPTAVAAAAEEESATATTAVVIEPLPTA